MRKLCAVFLAVFFGGVWCVASDWHPRLPASATRVVAPRYGTMLYHRSGSIYEKHLCISYNLEKRVVDGFPVLVLRYRVMPR